MTHLLYLNEKSSIAADTAIELDVDTRPFETASDDTISQQARRHGLSIELCVALRKSPELVGDMWLAQNGFTSSNQSAAGYARSADRRARRAGGSRGRQAVYVTDFELDAATAAYVQGEVSDPLAILLEAEEAEEASETSSDAMVQLVRSTASRARTAHRTRRRVQQLDAQRQRAIVAGQLGFAGFGWGLI
ncbi:hypothetical protein CH75_16805 [Dyella jiangningensis]|nr:hypothetical protein CH75_16805 [Dyella jiangningensis]